MAGSQSDSPNERLKRIKYCRRNSASELLVEELDVEDIAYDADVEILHPDQYEEIESEPENEQTHIPQRKQRDPDEELASRMRRLGCDSIRHRDPEPPNVERGRKRYLTDGDTEPVDLARDQLSDLEIMEVIDTTNKPRPTKRLRKHSRRPGSAQILLGGQDFVSNDSSDKNDHGSLVWPDTPESPSQAANLDSSAYQSDTKMEMS